MPLRGVVPAFYIVDVLPDITHEALDAIGRLQALAQLVEKSKTVEGEGFLQSLLEGACRSPIDLLQLGVETDESLFGGLVGRFLVGSLEPGSPGFLVGLRKVADNIFPLVPLTALDLRDRKSVV